MRLQQIRQGTGARLRHVLTNRLSVRSPPAQAGLSPPTQHASASRQPMDACVSSHVVAGAEHPSTLLAACRAVRTRGQPPHAAGQPPSAVRIR